MQRKHLIAFTLATIILLLGFNMMNGNRHEKNRAAQVASETPVATETAVDPNSADVDSTEANVNRSATIAVQPLGKQPKAIIDNVTADIEQAQQVEQQQLEQVDSAQ